MTSLKEELITADVVDYQFTRLYGNWVESIRDKDTVVARKYLNSLQEAFISLELIQENKKPPRKFMDLLERQNLDADLKAGIVSIYEVNKYSDKKKNGTVVSRDRRVDAYLERTINRVAKWLENPENSTMRIEIHP